MMKTPTDNLICLKNLFKGSNIRLLPRYKLIAIFGEKINLYLYLFLLAFSPQHHNNGFEYNFKIHFP